MAINLETARKVGAAAAAEARKNNWNVAVAIAAGRNAILGLPGATPVEGGLPIVVGGKMIGAIGVSGVNSPQDGVVAKAGADALK